MTNSQNSNGMGQVIAAIVIALIAGGTSPWWWNEFFNDKQSREVNVEEPSSQFEKNPPAENTQPNSVTESENQGIIEIDWSDSLNDLGIEKSTNELFKFSCEAGGTGDILYGTGMYTGSSSICEAAVHAGAITREQGGEASIQVKGRQQEFMGTQRNGVLSKGHSSYNTSFEVRSN